MTAINSNSQHFLSPCLTVLDTVLSALQVFSPFILTVSPWHQYCHKSHFSDETEAPAKSLALGHAAGRWPSWGSKPDNQATKLPADQNILPFPGLWLIRIVLTWGGPCHLRVWAEALSASSHRLLPGKLQAQQWWLRLWAFPGSGCWGEMNVLEIVGGSHETADSSSGK